MNTHDDGERLLTQSEAAMLLHVEPRTLESWRLRQTGPRFIRFSARCIRYRQTDLREWLTGRTVETAPELRAGAAGLK